MPLSFFEAFEKLIARTLGRTFDSYAAHLAKELRDDPGHIRYN
jgi:hypothetical protein